MTPDLFKVDLKFQSTPSAWRETLYHRSVFFCGKYFNPLPPHGGRLRKYTDWILQSEISIHSLRMEGDGMGEIYF